MGTMKIRITLVRSPFGRKPKRRTTLEALGLRRTQKSVVVENTPQIMGMVNIVNDLVTVEEVS
jgi:large subunit ribosomal protein L30